MPEQAVVNTTVLWISFGLYTAAIVAVGLYASKYAQRSDEDYFLAGRSLPGWLAALSASASSESGWVTLGLVGWAFGSGVSAYWIIPGCLCGFLFNWFVVAGRLHDESKRLEALTIPDYFAKRFNERLPLIRLLSVIVILTAMVLYVAAQFAAAGKAFAALSASVTYHQGVFIGAAIVMVYTISGGFRAVCWTDFLQSLLMIGTLVIFPMYLLGGGSGWSAMISTLENADPELVRFTPSKTGLALFGFLLGSSALGINFGYPGQPHVLVRFMSLRSRREALAGGAISFVWGLCVYAGAVTIGLLARAAAEGGATWATAMFEGEQKELALVLSAMHLLPAVLSGLVLAAVLAAICSTADSQLVVAGSSVASDLFSRLGDRTGRVAHMAMNRGTVLVLGLIAVALVYDEEVNVYSYVLTYGWAVLGAAFGPQMILALFWRKATYGGCLAGMLTGFAVAIGWNVLTNNKVAPFGAEGTIEVYNLPLAFVAAMLVNITVSVASGGRRLGVSENPRGAID